MHKKGAPLRTCAATKEGQGRRIDLHAAKEELAMTDEIQTAHWEIASAFVDAGESDTDGFALRISTQQRFQRERIGSHLPDAHKPI